MFRFIQVFPERARFLFKTGFHINASIAEKKNIQWLLCSYENNFLAIAATVEKELSAVSKIAAIVAVFAII